MSPVVVHLRLHLPNFRAWPGPDEFYVKMCKTLELKEGVLSFAHDCIHILKKTLIAWTNVLNFN